MGISKCYMVFFCVVCGILFNIISAQRDDQESVCNFRGCNCTTGAPGRNVNCTFDSAQSITLTPKSIPGDVLEFFVTGGKELVLFPQTFTALDGLSLIRIDGTRNVVLKKHSFHNVTAPSLTIQIQNCDQINIETGSFKNMLSTIVEISRTTHLSIAKSAFSRLSSAVFKDIQKLDLAESSFEFENQNYIGRHGPVTTLSFINVVIPKIPRAAFFSSLAGIEIQNSEIRSVEEEAFSAGQISAISILNTTLDVIKSGAFTEKTMTFNFVISKCNISQLQAKAINVGAISNLTVQHSRITDIQTGAINSTVANTIISDNEIEHFHTAAFSLSNWNRIVVDDNIIKYLHPDFLEVPINPDIYEFSFTDNEIYNVHDGAMSFIPALTKYLDFDNNFFNETCHCDISTWLEGVFKTGDVNFVMDTSYCVVTGLLSKCFQLQIGLINMQNFTELACEAGDTIVCEPYVGDTKIIDTTSKMLLDDDEDSGNSGLILGLTLGALLILAISGTIVILLIRGGLWLKRKGYFRNMRYNHNESSNDEENTIVTVDHNDDKLELPEELTPELLQTLRERLEDPQTHNEAREMIEKLYDMFIVDESYTNNNRQDEEAHLYEELGNLQTQQQHHQEIGSQDRLDTSEGAMSFLKLIEERLNLQPIDADVEKKPALAGDYSEPTDAAVHLYSELKQNRGDTDSVKKNSVKSGGSATMAFRPLPDKPVHDGSRPGPSSKP